MALTARVGSVRRDHRHDLEAHVEAQTPSPQQEARNESPPGSEEIELTIPARAEYVAVVRLTAAGIAARMLFSYDDIEDLKIAVSEACAAAVQAGGDQVTVRFGMTPDRLEIRVAHHPERARRRTRQSELGMLLVRCLMDEVRTERDGAQHITWMTKRLRQ